MRMEEGTFVKSHYKAINKVWTELQRAGGNQTEEEVTEIFLNSLPVEYDATVATINTILDSQPNILSMQWVLQQLKRYEDRVGSRQQVVVKDEQLLVANSSFARSQSHSGNYREKKRVNQSKITCYNCGKQAGHFASECPEPKSQNYRPGSSS